MNQRYQRACEIVGCDHEVSFEFEATAIEWLRERGGVSILYRGKCSVLLLGKSENDLHFGTTLTDALTEAVLAVEDTE